MTSYHVMLRDHYDADNDGTVDAAPLSDDNPQALGTTNAGTGSSAARADHVHAMPNRARGDYDAIVYIEGSEVVAEDSNGRKIASGVAGTDDHIVLNAAASIGGDIVIISNLSSATQHAVSPVANTTIRGLGKDITVLENIFFSLTAANCRLCDFSIVGDPSYYCNITPISVRVSNSIVENIKVSTVWSLTAFEITGDETTLSDITFRNVEAYRPTSHGFKNYGTNLVLERLLYDNCVVYDAGVYDNHNTWAVGFGFAAPVAGTVTIHGLNVTNCRVHGSWEASYYFEAGDDHTGIIFNNCFAENAGQKPVPTYGCGFLIPIGLDVIQLIGCSTRNCSLEGFRIIDNNSGGVHLVGCNDTGSLYGIRIDGSIGNIYIDDFVSDHCTGTGFRCMNSTGIHVHNMQVLYPAGDTSGYGVYISSTTYPVLNSDFDIHVITDSLTAGIYTNGAMNCKFSGSIHHSGKSGDEFGMYVSNPTGVLIDGMRFNIVGSCGIWIAGAVSDMYIHNIIFQDTVSGTLVNGIYNVAAGTYPVVYRRSIKNLGTLTTLYTNCLFGDTNSDSSTGTGSEQTIAHGLVAAPSNVVIVPTETGATVSAVWADATNIYCTVTAGKAYNWSAEV